jgi:hypothetical protein
MIHDLWWIEKQLERNGQCSVKVLSCNLLEGLSRTMVYSI